MIRFPVPLFAFLLGLMSATGFAPLGWWPVTLAAFAGLMHMVEQAKTRGGALLLGYSFGIGHFVLGLNWIAGSFRYQDAMPIWLGWVAVVTLAFYIAVYPAMAAGLAWRYGRGRPVVFVLFFASTWIATEYLRATMFTGFAWNPLSVAFLDGAQASIWIGTYGASGLALLVVGGLWLLARRRWQAGFWMLAASLGLTAAAVVAKSLEDSMAKTFAFKPKGKTAPYRIHIVQPNISQQDKHDETFDAVNFARLEQQTGVAKPEPRLILWPEAAIPDHIGEDDAIAANARARIASLMGPRDVLLTGNDKIFAERFSRDGILYERWIGAANSVYAMTAGEAILWRYDKSHLVPYGEYLPMRPILSAIGLSRLVPGDLDFWPGPGPKSFDIPGFGKAGVQLCYEIIFSGQVVDSANRPDFLFNPSNDAWFGTWGPPQHLAQARLRAMEEGLPVIRSTPTGISAIIDANGAVLRALPYQKAGFIADWMPPPHAATPFAQFGNSLALGFAVLLMLAGIALGRRLG